MPKKKGKKISKKKNRLDAIETKLNKVLALEKRQLKRGRARNERIEDLEKEEKKVESLERKQLKELEDIEKLERSISERVGKRPLTKITKRDIGKSLVGAFIGIVSHFVFLEGAHVAEGFTITRAIVFFIFSYVLGMIFIYATGFRKVKPKFLLAFVPFRITVIYIVSLFVVFIVLLLFGITSLPIDWILLFKRMAVISVPAIIGACAADLIGKAD